VPAIVSKLRDMTTPKKPGTSNHGALKPEEIKRRDATGHLDPKYAADLRAKSGKDERGNDRAFLNGHARSNDPLAESLGEQFVSSATTGESEAERAPSEDFVSEDVGGPFVITSGQKEFGKGIDRSNPKGATREPFPKT
jgi:hypothetical protein